MRNVKVLGKINQFYKDKRELKKRNSLRTYGVKSLGLLSETFKEVNKEYWLDFGTLLGAVREQDFIGHDYDIDVGTYFTSNEDVKSFEEIMVNKGFKKSREFFMNGKYIEETYIYEGVNLDIFYYYKEPKAEGMVYCFSAEEGEYTVYNKTRDGLKIKGLTVKKIGSTHSGTIKWIFFKGLLLPIPASYDQYLKDNYGDTYHIKDENWDWSDIENPILPFENNTEANIYN